MVVISGFVRVWFSSPYVYVAAPWWAWLFAVVLVFFLLVRFFGVRRVSR